LLFIATIFVNFRHYPVAFAAVAGNVVPTIEILFSEIWIIVEITGSQSTRINTRVYVFASSTTRVTEDEFEGNCKFFVFQEHSGKEPFLIKTVIPIRPRTSPNSMI
jgi:hypothetical protein